MIIVSDYELSRNKDNHISCLSHEKHARCPDYSSELHYRDSRERIWRTYRGKTLHILIRRLQCPRCHRLHNELPNILVPHKHYGAEVIENVVDEVVTPDDEDTEDYPCAATMERWKEWISGVSLLGALRAHGCEWLATVMHTIYNAAVRCQRSFAPALFCVSDAISVRYALGGVLP